MTYAPQMRPKVAEVVKNNTGKVYNFTNAGYNNALNKFGKTKVNGGGLTVGVNNHTHNNHKLNGAQISRLINNLNHRETVKNHFSNVQENINNALNNMLTAKIKEKTVPKAMKVVEEIQKADTESKLVSVAKKVKKLAVAEKVPKYAKAGKYLEAASNMMKKLTGKLIYTANGSVKQIFEENGKLHYKVGSGKRTIHSPKTKKVVKFNETKMVPVGEVYNASSGTVKRKYLNKNSGKILLKQSNGSHGNTAHFLYKSTLI
tara:strand:- start:2547 stop:3326 length:780 start_codon:yes stop_codon:yes gene_type:complete